MLFLFTFDKLLPSCALWRARDRTQSTSPWYQRDIRSLVSAMKSEIHKSQWSPLHSQYIAHIPSRSRADTLAPYRLILSLSATAFVFEALCHYSFHDTNLHFIWMSRTPMLITTVIFHQWVFWEKHFVLHHRKIDLFSVWFRGYMCHTNRQIKMKIHSTTNYRNSHYFDYSDAFCLIFQPFNKRRE